MKITTRIRLTMVLTALLGCAVVAVLCWARVLRDESVRRNRTTDQAFKDVMELNLQTHLFIQHPSPDTAGKWNAARDSLEHNLGDIRAANSADANLIAETKRILGEASDNFGRMVAATSALAGTVSPRSVPPLTADHVTRLLKSCDRLDDLLVGLKAASDERRVAIRDRSDLVLLGAVVGMVVLLATAVWLLGRSILRPIQRLRHGTEELMGGNLSHRVGHSGPDEVGELSRQFDKMATALEARIAERNRALDMLGLDEERLEALQTLSQMTDASMQEVTAFSLEEGVKLTKSEIGYLAFMNEDETVLTMHAWSKSAMRQCAVADKPFVYPVEKTGLWGEAVRQRRPIITNDYPAANPLKKGLPMGHVGLRRHMNVPIFDGDRIVALAGVGNKEEPYNDTDVRQLTLLNQGMWAIIQRRRVTEELRQHRDNLQALVAERTTELSTTVGQLQQEVAERKRTEERLERARHALEESNKDLQQFAYVASHDLQEPLRVVAGYVQLLARRYKGRLDADADDFIAFAVDGATRMQHLIQNLLDYSRLTTRGRNFAEVDTQKVFEGVLRDLAAVIEESGASITGGPLPSVRGDETQLAQLFQNLLSNAVKFRGREKPQIQVGARPLDGQWEFHVADNGIGIESKYFERIFVIFQRLHGRNEYPGTGIGLALCKKIVERHGGHIRVESTPGEGSAFRFTLPAAPKTTP